MFSIFNILKLFVLGNWIYDQILNEMKSQSDQYFHRKNSFAKVLKIFFN